MTFVPKTLEELNNYSKINNNYRYEKSRLRN